MQAMNYRAAFRITNTLLTFLYFYRKDPLQPLRPSEGLPVSKMPLVSNSLVPRA
jgi:hypothetical protein